MIDYRMLGLLLTFEFLELLRNTTATLHSKNRSKTTRKKYESVYCYNCCLIMFSLQGRSQINLNGFVR